MFAFNATLLIQIFNFFIAYAIVRLLIVKPMLTVIMQEDSFARSLRDLVHERKQAIEDKRLELEMNWAQCKADFAQHTPQAIKRSFPLLGKSRFNLIRPKPINTEHSLEELAHRIILQVNHVR